MASLFKKRITRYVESIGPRCSKATANAKRIWTEGNGWHYVASVGKQCSKSKPGAVKIRTESDLWYGRYKDVDGRTRELKLSSDKAAAQATVNRREIDAQRESAGLKDRFADERKRPLAEHVEDFRDYLASKNNSSKHVTQTVSRVHAIVAGCRFRYWPEVSASRVNHWLATQRAAGEFGLKTSNYYLGAIKEFCTWMVNDARAPESPLAYLDEVDTATEESLERRPLLPEEFALLVEAARQSHVVFRSLDGTDRAMLYLTAAYTGLRAQELANLIEESLRFEDGMPVAVVPAAYSKRRRKDFQPLRPDLADAMQRWLANRRQRFRADLYRPTFRHYVDAKDKRCKKTARGATPVDQQSDKWFARVLYPDGRDKTHSLDTTNEHEARAKLEELAARVGNSRTAGGSPAKLWPRTWWRVAAEMLRGDLEAARQKCLQDAVTPQERAEREKSDILCPVDADGLVFDFHALRHQFISNLAAAGVHPKRAQELARHSRIDLTMNRYTHLQRHDIAGELDKLPLLPPDLSCTPSVSSWCNSGHPAVVSPNAPNIEVGHQETKQPVASNGFNDQSDDVTCDKQKEARTGFEPVNSGFAIRPLSHLGTAPDAGKLRRSGFLRQEE